MTIVFATKGSASYDAIDDLQRRERERELLENTLVRGKCKQREQTEAILQKMKVILREKSRSRRRRVW